MLLAPMALHAQAKPPAPPLDIIVFVNGEQLTGTVTSANGDGVTFSSAMAGTITVKWANIKDLTSSKKFAVLAKNIKLTRKDAVALVPEGTIHSDGKALTIATDSGPKTETVANTSMVMDAAAFQKDLQPIKLTHGWGGTATAGASLVRATQDTTTFNGAINLIRATPTATWLPPHQRSIVIFTQSYGTTSQAGTPSVETNIFHASFEQDFYLSPRLYAFGSGTFDHNFSSNLGLEQAYGGGVGATVIKNAKQEVDFKGDAHYEKESFFNNLNSTTATTQDQNLFGSTFSENYICRLPKALVFNEFGSVSPSWHQSNSSAGQPNAYSAHANASLIFPVYKGFAFNLGAVDDYINNAPVGSKKNSTQYTTGITYVIKPR